MVICRYCLELTEETHKTRYSQETVYRLRLKQSKFREKILEYCPCILLGVFSTWSNTIQGHLLDRFNSIYEFFRALLLGMMLLVVVLEEGTNFWNSVWTRTYAKQKLQRFTHTFFFQFVLLSLRFGFVRPRNVLRRITGGFERKST